MRLLISLTFGFHLLLGNIALGGIEVVLAEDENKQVASHRTEIQMTVAPTMSTLMTLAVQGNEQVLEVPSGECSDHSHSDLLSKSSQEACPTDRCYAATDDFSQPIRALLIVRPFRGSDSAPSAPTLPTMIAGASSIENEGGLVQRSSPLAFHFSNVILRE